jgi:excisionase family DNA binding protein
MTLKQNDTANHTAAAPPLPPRESINRLVYNVPEAGAMLGLKRQASYDAAARGDIPTIRIGRLLRVPRAAFHRLLDSA